MNQVTLPVSYTLGYMRIFGLEQEIVKQEIQILTLRSENVLSGSFTLNVSDADGVSQTTGTYYIILYLSNVSPWQQNNIQHNTHYLQKVAVWQMIGRLSHITGEYGQSTKPELRAWLSCGFTWYISVAVLTVILCQFVFFAQ